jgi:putative phosphoribosyl transferase
MAVDNSTRTAGPARMTDGEVLLPALTVELAGTLAVPPDSCGLVLFAHGSGSSRHSPRNAQMARTLQDAGLATLLFDLLTEDEAGDRANVFDVELLAARLAAVTRHVGGRGLVRGLPVGYVGASTGAAAALIAAAELGPAIGAVVSRGGRPGLAERRLGEVTAPTLLIVGGHDPVVLELNESAARRLRCPHRIAVVPGATHLFEEPGTLDQAARLARDWLREHLAGRSSAVPG